MKRMLITQLVPVLVFCSVVLKNMSVLAKHSPTVSFTGLLINLLFDLLSRRWSSSLYHSNTVVVNSICLGDLRRNRSSSIKILLYWTGCYPCYPVLACLSGVTTVSCTPYPWFQERTVWFELSSFVLAELFHSPVIPYLL